MSIHRSLKTQGKLVRERNVFSRAERLEVLKKEGRVIDSPAQVGGYPIYPPGTAPNDSDEDGMPDAWETANRLDKTKANANGRDLDPNYDNIEVYVNGLFRVAPAEGH